MRSKTEICEHLRMLSSWIDGEGPDDLVGAHHWECLREAADEIERHGQTFEGGLAIRDIDFVVARLRSVDFTGDRWNRGSEVGEVTWPAADIIERLRAERDEIRREWCEKEAVLWDEPTKTPQSLAKERGWDCFKEASG
jgi:hypothetical protein